MCGEDNPLDERKVDLECSVKSTLVLLAVSLSVFLFALWGEGELRNGCFIVFKAMWHLPDSYRIEISILSFICCLLDLIVTPSAVP